MVFAGVQSRSVACHGASAPHRPKPTPDAFRCAKRAYPQEPKIWINDDELLFEGAHSGYKRLKGKLIHRRRISWNEDVIVIEDDISGKYKHDYLLTLNFHPLYKIHLKDGTAHINCGDEPKLLIHPLYDAELSVTKGWYCPEFGQKIKNSNSELNGF